jgi:diaminopimelate epimerase
MMRVEKWHGAGNDFLVLDSRDVLAVADWPASVRRLCDRRRGIGADGVLLLESGGESDLRMRYWNADGSEAGMCGNGGRVLAAFASQRGLGKAGEVRFHSAWGAHRAQVEQRSKELYQVALELPDVAWPVRLEADVPWGRATMLRVDCGVPHLVVSLSETPVRDLSLVDVEGWGRTLRGLEDLGRAGANVDFVAVPASGPLSVRTYERGVEGETLACGTGAIAVAAASAYWEWRTSPVSVLAWSGDVLEVSYQVEGRRLSSVSLTGPAARVFTAELSSIDS